jgi:hypothetical protein
MAIETTAKMSRSDRQENRMNLKSQLDAQQRQSHELIPAETRTLMDEATDALRQSGIVARSLKVGETMPAFALPNATGRVVSSAELLANGPLVVSFYRGGW